MSQLPTRKKSAEEIAQLRDSLGIHVASSSDPQISGSPHITEPVESVPAARPQVEKKAEPIAKANVPDLFSKEEAPVAGAALPAALASPHVAPKQVRSLRRSERVPVMAAADAGAPAEAEPVREVAKGRQVRSLRKTEQAPVLLVVPELPSADSILPFNRHSHKELNEIRRQAAISQPSGPPHFLTKKAHLWLVIPGYVMAIAGWVGLYFDQFPVTAGCAVGGLVFSTFIFLKKPLSLHHAAFISVIVTFLIVFGALYYFPHLRHGT